MNISVKNSPHFTWGNGCDAWWLKKDGFFTVVLEMMPAGTFEKNHLHCKTEQFFYCLEGQLTIICDGAEYNLSANEGCVVLQNHPHNVQNNSGSTVRFLVISCLNSHEDRIDLE